MIVRGETLWLVRMLGGRAMRRRRYEINRVRLTRAESQKLAEAMRRLPGMGSGCAVPIFAYWLSPGVSGDH
jgi:hypothetical protein